VLFGRRQPAVEFAFIFLCSWWFVLKKRINRVVLVTGLSVGVIMVFATGLYRSVVVSRSDERDWGKLLRIDYTSAIKEVAREGSSETEAAVYLMAAIADKMTFDFGATNWNSLVFNYVPGQIIGHENKSSLYIPCFKTSDAAYALYGFSPHRGSTVTGMTDCYGSFWYFGCLKFFGIAFIMRLLYNHAATGSLLAQCLYIIVMTMALHAITHHTGWFVNPWVMVLIFIRPVFEYARIGESNEDRRYFSPSWTIPHRPT